MNEKLYKDSLTIFHDDHFPPYRGDSHVVTWNYTTRSVDKVWYIIMIEDLSSVIIPVAHITQTQRLWNACGEGRGVAGSQHLIPADPVLTDAPHTCVSVCVCVCCSPPHTSTLLTPDTDTLFVGCWPSVADAGPTSNKHCVRVWCFLGSPDAKLQTVVQYQTNLDIFGDIILLLFFLLL